MSDHWKGGHLIRAVKRDSYQANGRNLQSVERKERPQVAEKTRAVCGESLSNRNRSGLCRRHYLDGVKA